MRPLDEANCFMGQRFEPKDVQKNAYIPPQRLFAERNRMARAIHSPNSRTATCSIGRAAVCSHEHHDASFQPTFCFVP